MIFWNILLLCFGCQAAKAFHNGAPCSAQYLMTPSAIFHGIAQNPGPRPPPYQFSIIDQQGYPVTKYRNEIYKVRILANPGTTFRGFLLQARPASAEGYPLGHFRAGQFIPDHNSWKLQGIKIQECRGVNNDSLTHATNDDRQTLEVLWKPMKNYGPILFMLTVVQNRTLFWTQWLPSAGLIFPDDTGFNGNDVSKKPVKEVLKSDEDDETTTSPDDEWTDDEPATTPSILARGRSSKDHSPEVMDDDPNPPTGKRHKKKHHTTTTEASEDITQAQPEAPAPESSSGEGSRSGRRRGSKTTTTTIEPETTEMTTTRDTPPPPPPPPPSTSAHSKSGRKNGASASEEFGSEQTHNQNKNRPDEQSSQNRNRPEDPLSQNRNRPEDSSSPSRNRPEDSSSPSQNRNRPEDSSSPTQSRNRPDDQNRRPEESLPSQNRNRPDESSPSQNRNKPEDPSPSSAQSNSDRLPPAPAAAANGPDDFDNDDRRRSGGAGRKRPESLISKENLSSRERQSSKRPDIEGAPRSSRERFGSRERLSSRKPDIDNAPRNSKERFGSSEKFSSKKPDGDGQAGQRESSFGENPSATHRLSSHEENPNRASFRPPPPTPPSQFDLSSSSTAKFRPDDHRGLPPASPAGNEDLPPNPPPLNSANKQPQFPPLSPPGQPEESDTTDYCAERPCKNNGTCINVPDEDRFECKCVGKWAGLHCTDPNLCIGHKCQNGAQCVNGLDKYSCKCPKEWGGDLCDKSCPAYLCENGGTCVIINDQFGCVCAPGFTGPRCHYEIKHCDSNPCQNGATCVHKFNSFECKCKDGFMGETCHRPCQDVYRSCDFWGEQDKCESQRPTTKWFDINCAKTCEQCKPDNKTINTHISLPPVLEPFEFILGKWALNSTDRSHFPLDFPSEATGGYYEELTFHVTEVPQFGPPSINVTAIATNLVNRDDVMVSLGFLTVRPATQPLKTFMMMTGNDGVTVVEDGITNSTGITLQAQYFAIFPAVDDKAPAISKRILSMANQQYLKIEVERTGNSGQKDYFTKYYTKIEKAVPY